MRAIDIKEGEIYRLKSSPNFGYIKVIKVLKARQKLLCYIDFKGDYHCDENKNPFIVVKCLHSTDTNFNFAFVRLFRPANIIKYL